MSFASQIISKRICRDQAVLRLPGCPVARLPGCAAARRTERPLRLRSGQDCRSGSCGPGTAPLSAGVPEMPKPPASQACRSTASPRIYSCGRCLRTNRALQQAQESLAFGGLLLGNIHVEKADQVASKALPLRLVGFRCPADGRCHGVACSNAGLTVSDAASTAQCVEAVVQR